MHSAPTPAAVALALVLLATGSAACAQAAGQRPGPEAPATGTVEHATRSTDPGTDGPPAGIVMRTRRTGVDCSPDVGLEPAGGYTGYEIVERVEIDTTTDPPTERIVGRRCAPRADRTPRGRLGGPLPSSGGLPARAR